MKALILAVAFLLSSASNLLPQQNQKELEDALIAIMKNEFRAFKTKNPALWEPFADDEAIFTGIDAGYKSKLDIIQEIKNAPEIYMYAEESYDGITVKQIKDLAVLSCFAHLTFSESDGKTRILSFKFNRVHLKSPAGWRLLYHSAIPL